MAESASDGKKSYFTQNLMRWHSLENNRDLPWKGETDPYRIWLSEVILQQTRALQGLPYYEAFTNGYPDVFALAAANDDDVFRVWQGLGYYNRCRNMLATARHIVGELHGTFPNTYEGLLSLKGVGPYTAAAIGSFAFGLPTAVLDGNVYRVLARYFGIETSSDAPEAKVLFSSLANELLDKKHSAAYNQAIMDLGATICTPASPKCSECPLHRHCFAAAHHATQMFPVRTKKVKVTTRHFNYAAILHNDAIWIKKRKEGDIWSQLYEPMMIETTSPITPPQFGKLLEPFGISRDSLSAVSDANSRQRLTHQLIHAYFYTVTIADRSSLSLPEDGTWVSINELKKLAFPKTLVSFFRKILYF